MLGGTPQKPPSYKKSAIGGLILGGFGGLTKLSEYKFKGNHEFYIFELSILNFYIPMVPVKLFMFMSFLKPLFSTSRRVPDAYKVLPLFSTPRRVPITLHPFSRHFAGYL